MQKEKLATPSFKVRKERKAGLLVSPKDVTVLGSVDIDEQSSADSSAHPPAFTTPKTTVYSLPTHTSAFHQSFCPGLIVPLADQDNVYKKGGEVTIKPIHQKPSTSE